MNRHSWQQFPASVTPRTAKRFKFDFESTWRMRLYLMSTNGPGGKSIRCIYMEPFTNWVCIKLFSDWNHHSGASTVGSYDSLHEFIVWSELSRVSLNSLTLMLGIDSMALPLHNKVCITSDEASDSTSGCRCIHLYRVSYICEHGWE
jgi:hypothetical protein